MLILGVFALFAGISLRNREPQPSALISIGDGSINFVNRTKSSGIDYQWTIDGPRPLDILQGIGNGCAFLDYNNDGNLDILLVGPQLALYKGDGQGHFTDVTHQVGLDKFHGHFLGCAVGDYDNDGYDDLYISGWHTGLLLHNEHGTGFKDVTQEAGLKPQPWGTSCAFGDVDNDGKLDLYVGNYLVFDPDKDQRLCEIPDMPDTACGPGVYHHAFGVLYHNEGNGRFRDVTAAWGTSKATGAVLGVAFADYVGSGRQSLFLADDNAPQDLLTNQGHAFVNNGVKAGIASTNGQLPNGMGIDWGDYDNDGRLDAVLATFSEEVKPIFHNEGTGLFSDDSQKMGIGTAGLHRLSFGVKWFDFDNDGWLDVMFTNGHVLSNAAEAYHGESYRQTCTLFHNEHGKHFTDVTLQAGQDFLPAIVGRGLAVGDYDNDGKMDALVVDSEGRPLLLHNESRKSGHWLSFLLEGTRCNQDGYGARVTVKAGGLTQTRFCHADGSYLSSSDKRVHVGVAEAIMAESVIVKWPDSHQDVYHHVPADQQYFVKEGSQVLMPRLH